MAFPLTPILDDFNRADIGPPPSASWLSTNPDGGSAFAVHKVVSNQLSPNAAASWSCWNTTYGPDCEVYADVPTLGTLGNTHQLYLRMTPDTVSRDGYTFVLKSTSSTLADFAISRVDNTVETTIGATVTGIAFAAGDAFGGSAIGNILTLWARRSGVWSPILDRYDATYTAAGKLDVFSPDATIRLDNFGGGTLGTSQFVRRAYYL